MTYRLLLLVLGILCAFTVQSQHYMPAFDTAQVAKYTFTDIGHTQHPVKVRYARASMVNASALEDLKSKKIASIDLVYSDYPKGKDLSELNQQRMAELYRRWPELFKMQVKWSLVSQTGCETEAEAASLFHGFVFHIEQKPAKPDPIERLSMEGAKSMELLLNGDVKPTDSTVLRIMERNKTWDDILVVADLTGSMAPYIGQLLLWVKLNSAKRPAKFFVFFNDGDGKPDYEKVLGNTGGVYGVDASSLDSVLSVAKRTMENGLGGDEAENNIEALMYGIKAYPQYKEIIMIADNWATPRDLALLSQVKVPFRIILCGTEKGINPRYLDIARYTRGSVHTMDDDINRLIELNEGESIQVGGRRYKIVKGRFVAEE